MAPSPQLFQQHGKLSPDYFLVRKTGEIVPLIAADELPPSIDIVNVPRSIDLEETIGMLNLGMHRHSGSFYQLVHSDRKAASTDSPSYSRPAESISQPPSIPRDIPAPNQAITRLIPPSLETQLCRHWCVHGICKWGQNCRYRHTMPMNAAGLKEVGLADWPTWYRRLNASYFASEKEMAKTTAVAALSKKSVKKTCTAGDCCAGEQERSLGSRAALVERERSRVVPGRTAMALGDLDEQIRERMRGFTRDGKGTPRLMNEDVREGANERIERAVGMETRRWEDDSDDSGEVDVVVKEVMEHTKGKLVDV